MTLHHESPVPLYTQIKELLHKRILSGEYAVGARLPSERELAERYDVSRMTARQALRALALEGLTYSIVGKGTFVSVPKINQELRLLSGFSEDMIQRGLKPSSRVIEARQSAADEQVCSRLHLQAGATIILLKRVRLADHQPMALEATHIPVELCPDLLERFDFSRDSLYEVLRRNYGLDMVWADQLIETRLPTDTEREILGVAQRTPVLKFTRVTYNAENQPLEYVRSVYRGDQYQLRTILRYAE